MPDFAMVRQVMEEYKPKSKMASSKRSLSLKEKIPLYPSPPEIKDTTQVDIYRQAASKKLMVNVSSFEIFRNDITKKVKLLDVKLSFSYQDKFTTETVRLEKQLVRHGKKWTWISEDGDRNVITFPYMPGDRVNMNMGIIIHKTKKHGLFGKETVTSQVGTTTECIVLAKNNGVGMGLQLNEPITQKLRLNFNLNGHGHFLTVKLRLDLKSETKGPPILWLRPMSSDKKFRSLKSSLDLLHTLPPKDKDEDARVKMFIYNQQKIVNYQRTGVLECRSIRPYDMESEIPTGIEIRQVIGGNIISYLIPVVSIIDSQNMRYRLAILVVTKNGPYCLCSAKWKSADKFDYKIHMFKTNETFGQRIKWASKDFLDISYTVMNSTGHQFTLRPEMDNAVEDICIGLCLKFLVRWCNEPLPWKQQGSGLMLDAQKYLLTKYSCTINQGLEAHENDINSQLNCLPLFLESKQLLLFTDVEEFFGEDGVTVREHKAPILRTGSNSSYGESEMKTHNGELNIENEVDEDDVDNADNTTVDSKPKFDIEWDDITSRFVDSEVTTGAGSWVDSVL